MKYTLKLKKVFAVRKIFFVQDCCLKYSIELHKKTVVHCKTRLTGKSLTFFTVYAELMRNTNS
jgi:hypothetical protein